ncbi:MAG: 3'(2'),5'-bisphosphate nucleotidase CysQ [Actinomycetota bacterium]|nr:3'(2'),5'-bisphosphate nucleotidase CysQ [Actinomycetota bacterium]
MSRLDDLNRIDRALDAAVRTLEPFTPGAIEATMKQDDDPVTAADLAVNDVLLGLLPQPGEGWLFEETADGTDRLGRDRVWIVDPIDGTREFVQGIPEWSISIGLVEHGRPVAGGVCNPATGERIIGSIETGVRYTGHRPATSATSLADAIVLASRSEMRRGEWERFFDESFTIVPMGSVAYKLALVAAGRADATWTLVPKHEWDVAAGAALVLAAGGWIALPDGSPPTWNNPDPLLPGLIATTSAIAPDVARALGLRSHQS